MFVCVFVCVCVCVCVCIIIHLHAHTYQGPMSATAVEFVVRFLGYAVKAQRFGGISWRVDDVLAPILTLSTNQVLNCYTKVD